MSVQITSLQKVSLTLYTADAHLNPISPRTAGTATWNNANPELVTLTPAADGLSAEVVAVGPVGTAQIFGQIQTDDLGLQGFSIYVEVIPGPPAKIAVVPGTPVTA